MTLFTWEEKYSVGIDSIDKQHKHFFEIANRLIMLEEKKNPTAIDLSAMISELEEYAFYHLQTEEKCFDTLHYPDAPKHVREHNVYREKIAHYIITLADPKINIVHLAKDIANYSINWLTNHILFTDKEYSTFFKEHGVV